MQVTETSAEGLKREYKIVVPASDIEQQITDRLKDLAQTARLPGFRPGKVPVSLMRKRYGSAVMGEVLEKAVNESSQQAISERELRLALQPKIEIETFDEGKDLEYKMNVELFPDFEPMDFKKLKLEQVKVEPTDEEIEKSLTRLAEAHGESEPVKTKRKSKKGDIAVIDFVGKVDGEPFAGGAAEDYQLELGSGTFIPGFEDQVIGAKAGDELEVKVSFPEEYGAEDLAGKEAVFDVTVKELRQPAPAPLDDELAKKVGMESLDKLKEAVREEHAREYNNMARMRLKRQLFDQLQDAHDFPLPQGMIEQEFEGIWKQFEETRAQNPDAIDDEDKGKSDEELQDEYRKLAERRVRLALVLSEVGRRNEIDVNAEELQRAMLNEARKYPGQEKMVFEYFQKNPQAMEALRGPIFEDKVVDYVVELADVKERTVTPEGFMEEEKKAHEESEAKKAKPKKKAAAKSKTAKKDEAAKESGADGDSGEEA